jgi:hypothetical protein
MIATPQSWVRVLDQGEGTSEEGVVFNEVV